MVNVGSLLMASSALLAALEMFLLTGHPVGLGSKELQTMLPQRLSTLVNLLTPHTLIHCFVSHLLIYNKYFTGVDSEEEGSTCEYVLPFLRLACHQLGLLLDVLAENNGARGNALILLSLNLICYGGYSNLLGGSLGSALGHVREIGGSDGGGLGNGGATATTAIVTNLFYCHNPLMPLIP